MNWLMYIFIFLIFGIVNSLYSKFMFKQKIKNFNKRFPEVNLDPNTKLSTYTRRFDDWKLVMFCDKVKNDNIGGN